MEILGNLDLLSVAIAIAGALVLGFAIYFTDKQSITNKTFVLFTLVTAAWGVLNYLSYQISNLNLAISLLRLEVFFAVWHTFLIFQLLYIFPQKKVVFGKVYYFLLVPISIAISILCLTNYIFASVRTITSDGYINTLNPGPGIILFGVYTISFISVGFFTLYSKIAKSNTKQEKNSLTFFFVGGVAMFSPIIILNFIFPAFLDNPTYVPFGAVSIFPFIIFTSYSILKYKLFNIKVIGVSVLVFALSVVTFIEIIFSKDIFVVFYRSSVFVLILSFGILLIKGVLTEVEQREKIEKQEKELEIANQQQVALLHFVTHQIRGFFTKSKYIFAGIVSGDYGNIPQSILEIAKEGLSSDDKGIAMIHDILNSANLKNGTVKYESKPIDLKSMIEKIADEQKVFAETKGLAMVVDIDKTNQFNFIGDETQLKQVFKNLIDNAVRYTQNGKVQIKLIKLNGKILFTTEDTGVGITQEDMKRLFTEGGRGKNSLHVNTDSSGYGLYIVKQIVEAHKGRVWAESEGEGKGARFCIEL